MIFLLDTNSISYLLKKDQQVLQNYKTRSGQGATIAICMPVYYEIIRGLLKHDSKQRLQQFNNEILPALALIPVVDADWMQAAQFWAITRSKGRQLSDMDLLLAALAHRLKATIASSDTDFDALPVKRESWRDSPLTD